MPYNNDPGTGDLEKLQKAFSELSENFGSVENILDAFGLSDMPTAQRYGIIFGFLVFTGTVTAVAALLTLGGSFRRLAEQSETGESTVLTASEARTKRALLLEQLLEGRERMSTRYAPQATTSQPTLLTQLLLTQAPDATLNGATAAVDENKPANEQKNQKKKKKQPSKGEGRYIPPHYVENYTQAYRRCQDRPGGAIITGRPEARFEAYARAFAGCGPYTANWYRCSYGRVYEAVACQNHTTDTTYEHLFRERPYDIVGKHARLEALDPERHSTPLFAVTCGDPIFEHKSYDAQEVWGFRDAGPYETPTELASSFVFQHESNAAGFAIVESLTDRVIGAILLKDDNPRNLTIAIEPDLVAPFIVGTPVEIEAYFLLMDRLFGLGYRRIQIAVDSQHLVAKKLCQRLGFNLDGVLFKHMVVKEANRDSCIYGLLNSDWKKGARAHLFKKLYGAAALRFESANQKFEEEEDEKARSLLEMKKVDDKKKA